MTKTIFTAAALALLAPTAALAHTTPIVIQVGTPDRVTPASDSSTERAIEVAAEAACERPFMRNLKGQALYAQCLSEARAAAEARTSGTEVAFNTVR